jgi:hypothetical protein
VDTMSSHSCIVAVESVSFFTAIKSQVSHWALSV